MKPLAWIAPLSMLAAFPSCSARADECPVCADENSARAVELASLRVLIDDAQYLAEIVESDERGADRRIRIRCIAACSPEVSLEERAPGFPLGLFRLTDAHPLVLATWGGATATVVQVFELDRMRIRKVFERYTTGPPAVEERGRGGLSITTMEYPTERRERERGLITRTWLWNGIEFTPIPSGS